MNELNKLEQYLVSNHIAYEREDDEGVVPSWCNNLHSGETHAIYIHSGNDIIEIYCNPGCDGYRNGLLEVINGKESIGHQSALQIIKRLTEGG